jgi:hypothetical protein
MLENTILYFGDETEDVLERPKNGNIIYFYPNSGVFEGQLLGPKQPLIYSQVSQQERQPSGSGADTE